MQQVKIYFLNALMAELLPGESGCLGEAENSACGRHQTRTSPPPSACLSISEAAASQSLGGRA